MLASTLLTIGLIGGLTACATGGSGAGKDSPVTTTVPTVPMANPIDRSRDTVDQLNQQQEELEQQTGG
jgi:hypothetical protein